MLSRLGLDSIMVLVLFGLGIVGLLAANGLRHMGYIAARRHLSSWRRLESRPLRCRGADAKRDSCRSVGIN